MNLIFAIASVLFSIIIFLAIFFLPARLQPRVGRPSIPGRDELADFRREIHSVDLEVLAQSRRQHGELKTD